MRTDPTQINLPQASADVEALLRRAGYQGPIEDIADLAAAEERSLERQELAGFSDARNNEFTRGRRENDASDPNSDTAKQRQAYQVAGQTAAITQQLVQLTTKLTQHINYLTTEIAGLEARELDLARQEGILGEHIEVAQENAKAAETEIDETLTEIDGHSSALEAALDSREAAKTELCSAPEGGGFRDAGVVTERFNDITDAERQARMAIQQIDSASVRIYEQEQIRDQALGEAQALTTEQQQIINERLGVRTQIAELTEELELTEAQLAALGDDAALDAIRSGEMTPQQAIDGVTRPTALDGSSLATPAAADADGLGVVSSVELRAGFNTSSGIIPTAPAVAAPAMQQTLRAPEMAPRPFAPA